ncbi:MAG: 2Fe-2S ferredoxin [Deltaproteobacteria bacterium SG8_13]|nr:MAG: 2Fe-2S ferredoxin [Deltaproteobacteria bacterium SG8_13]
MIQIRIDGRGYEAEEGKTVLEVLRDNRIHIPTLCYHPVLRPSGSCKLCAVEVSDRVADKKIALLSCILKVREGLDITTGGQLVQRARVRAFRDLLRMAPQARSIIDLAKAFDVDPGPPPDGCIRCRLCIRVCKEIVGPGALKMEKRDGQKFVVPIEGHCIGCGTCANICPTKVIVVEDRDNVRKITIRGEVIGRHPLERCEGCGRYFATPRFLDHIHHRTALHADTKIHHNYCPTCAKLFSDRIKSISDRSRK